MPSLRGQPDRYRASTIAASDPNEPSVRPSGSATASGDVRADELDLLKGRIHPARCSPPATREEYREYVRREFLETEILHPEEIVAGGHSLAPRFLQVLPREEPAESRRTNDRHLLPAQPGTAVERRGRDELAGAIRGGVRRRWRKAVARGEIGVVRLRHMGWASRRLRMQRATSRSRKWSRSRATSPATTTISAPFRCRSTSRCPRRCGSRLRPSNGTLGSRSDAAEELGLTVLASAPLLQAKLTSGLPAAIGGRVSRLRDGRSARAVVRARASRSHGGARRDAKRDEHIDENSHRALP